MAGRCHVTLRTPQCPSPSRSPTCGSGRSFSTPSRTGSGRRGGRRTAIRSTILTGRLRENLNAAPIPLALVAHQGSAFLGTASVIASDLAERPQLTPWIAAVWVDPQARQHGIGAALVNRAAQDCFAIGIGRALSMRAAGTLGFLPRAGLDADRTGCRPAPLGGIYPGCKSRRRSGQFAAMKIDRPNPVR